MQQHGSRLPPPAPTAASERVAALDIIRGFALFGILLVNMAFFNSPFTLIALDAQWWPGALDRGVQWLIRLLAEGKFFSLFSLLFGLGLAVQMQRLESRGAAFVPLYLRRMLVLLLIGIVHAFFVWPGDILIFYALLGCVLLLFRRRQDRTLKVWMLVCLLIPVVVMSAAAGLLALGRSVPEGAAEIERALAAQTAAYQAMADQALAAYAAGTFAEITAVRVAEYGFMATGTAMGGFAQIFVMFLIGLYAGRQGIWQNISGHLPLLRRVFWWGLALGLAANAVFVVATESSNVAVPDGMGIIRVTAHVIGAPALSLCYAAGIALLLQKAAWQRRLGPLAAVGRLALSNYLLQSVICTLIFYSYGLGLYGQVGPAAGLALTLVIYLAQVPLSRWWLGRYQYGPAEWLWRTLTYGRRQPMRLPLAEGM